MGYKDNRNGEMENARTMTVKTTQQYNVKRSSGNSLWWKQSYFCLHLSQLADWSCDYVLAHSRQFASQPDYVFSFTSIKSLFVINSLLLNAAAFLTKFAVQIYITWCWGPTSTYNGLFCASCSADTCLGNFFPTCSICWQCPGQEYGPPLNWVSQVGRPDQEYLCRG